MLTHMKDCGGTRGEDPRAFLEEDLPVRGASLGGVSLLQETGFLAPIHLTQHVEATKSTKPRGGQTTSVEWENGFDGILLRPTSDTPTPREGVQQRCSVLLW